MALRLCFATNNKNKLLEVREIVPGDIKIVSLNQIGHEGDLPEDKNTIEGNSVQKAEFINKKYNINCFADDTGLEVMALKGNPGVYSARYAGIPVSSQRNVNKLLKELNDFPDRTARFKSVITLIIDHNSIQFEGIIKGKITEHPTGDNGFGYDPVFIPDGYDKTFAEMSSTLKNQISHRAIAIKKLMEYLSTIN